MTNFDYMTPTRLIFGKDSIEKLPDVMKRVGTIDILHKTVAIKAQA